MALKLRLNIKKDHKDTTYIDLGLDINTNTPNIKCVAVYTDGYMS